MAVAVVGVSQKDRGALHTGQHLFLPGNPSHGGEGSAHPLAAKNVQVQAWPVSCPEMIRAFPRLGLHLNFDL